MRSFDHKHCFRLALLTVVVPLQLMSSVSCSASDPSGADAVVPRDRDGNDAGQAASEGGKKDGSDSGTPQQFIGDTVLSVLPANTTLFIDTSKPGIAATQVFAAMLGNGGVGKDVTSDTKFSLADSALGAFNGASFTSALDLPSDAMGVTTTIRAVANGQAGEAKLTLIKLRRSEDATGKRDFFYTVPYKKDPDPKRDLFKFATDLQKVDIAFIMDSTGSMQPCIDNLTRSLTTNIIPELAKIPSVAFGVVDHRDWGDAWAVKVRQTISTDKSKVSTALSQMRADGGGDGPEAQLAAMHHALTGDANGTIAKHVPASGTYGGVDFRPGAVPVLVQISNSSWHDPSGNVTMANTQAAFKQRNAKFVSIFAAPGANTPQADSLADATQSILAPDAFRGKCGAGKCCTEAQGLGRAPDAPGGRCRLNFRTDTAGSDISTSVISAIQAIAVGATYDIKAVLSNDPTNKDGIDATEFVQALRAMDEGNPSSGCPAHAAYDSDNDGIKDTFKEVIVSTPVCFEVIPKMNTTVPPELAAVLVKAFIDMVGEPGHVTLGDHRSVIFLIPPKDPDVSVR